MSSIKPSRGRLTIEQKYHICMQNLKFPNETQAELGEWAKKEFNLKSAVKQKTISNILNSKDKVFSAYAKGNGKSKANQVLKMPQLDDDIADYLTDLGSRGYPVNRLTVVAYAKVIANSKYKMHELPKKDRLKFSDGWVTDMLRRIGFKSRKLHGESSSVDLTSANIIGELRKIEKLLEPYDPEDILNFDETGLYYEQQPTRTISSKPMGGAKKSKNRFTVGLLTNYDGSYKGHPIVIGRRKTPKAATRKPALYRKTTCIGQTHYIEYHSNQTAWMTTEIFRKYIKRLNSSFAYAKRNVAILLDNASVHKLKEEFSNIKLIFLPANTTSKLQPLDAGIIANFKAHFRWHQYYRATNKYVAGVDLDLVEEYRMDEVDALFFLADAWRKVKPETIKNCWDHATILNFKFPDQERIETEDAIPTFRLPLDDTVVRNLNEIIPDLPGNRDDNGNPLVTEVEELDLAADESDSMVFRPELVQINEDGTVKIADEIDEEETEIESDEEEEVVDVKEICRNLKQAYETILYHSLAMDNQDISMLKTVLKMLGEIRSEEIAEEKQTTLLNYFS